MKLSKSEKMVIAVMQGEIATKSIYYKRTRDTKKSIYKAIQSLKDKGIIKMGSNSILEFVK